MPLALNRQGHVVFSALLSPWLFNLIIADPFSLARGGREIDQRQRQKQDTQKALAHLERFCHQVSKGLTSLTFDERQQLLRLVIERITVENGVARIDTVIPPDQDNLRNRYPDNVYAITPLRFTLTIQLPS